ncbi:MAG: branched-chain amino acid dehydrogenase, partial [Oscillospiraceae bacterium]|nr:branched-chain amino acid dehydrogenase [Oscillospiraceae bacterium]
MAKSKVMAVDEAIKKYCKSGMTVLLPGFVNVGVSEVLIEGLIDAGLADLDVISNNTSVKGRGIGKLVAADLIKHI